MPRRPMMIAMWGAGTAVAMGVAVFGVNLAGTRVTGRLVAPISPEQVVEVAAAGPVDTASTDGALPPPEPVPSTETDDADSVAVPTTQPPDGQPGSPPPTAAADRSTGPGGTGPSDGPASSDAGPGPAAGGGGSPDTPAGPQAGSASGAGAAGGDSNAAAGARDGSGSSDDSGRGQSSGSDATPGGGGSGSGSGGGGGSGSPGGPPATQATTPAVPRSQVFTLVGGSAALTCTGTAIRVDRADPASGFSVKPNGPGPATDVTVEFERRDPRHRSRLRASCSGGEPRATETLETN